MLDDFPPRVLAMLVKLPGQWSRSGRASRGEAGGEPATGRATALQLASEGFFVLGGDDARGAETAKLIEEDGERARFRRPISQSPRM
jgi:hypothetical protein